MASTIKVDTIDTPSGSGNITLNRPIAGDGSNLTGLGYTEVGVATTTSGSTSTISGIPAAVKTVMIVVNATSNTGAAELQLLLGDSGGIETSGYLSMSHRSDVGTVTHSSDTTYILLANGGGGADPYSGIGHLTRSASGVNTWVYTSIIYQSIQAQNWTSATKSLSGELTQIQLKTSGTFDAGNWNIYYQK